MGCMKEGNFFFFTHVHFAAIQAGICCNRREIRKPTAALSVLLEGRLLVHSLSSVLLPQEYLYTRRGGWCSRDGSGSSSWARRND